MAGSVSASPGVSLTPTATKIALPTNYITDFSFINQYLPDVHDAEFEAYGNRSVASFLRLVGAEIPTNSDLIKWAEQGRLHTKYEDVVTATADAADTTVFTRTGGLTFNFRANQTLIFSDNAADIIAKGVVSAINAANTQLTVEWYEAAGQPTGFNASAAITTFVFGSEFKKGSAGMVGALESVDSFYDNKTIIIKEKYTVSGSDMAQIGWVNTTTESGGGGYYWFLKSQGDTRTRFEDYTEMSMIEAVSAENASGAEVFLSDNTGGGNAGSEGMFEAIETRGNVWAGGNPSTLDDFDAVIARLDKQGAIRENVLFLDRGFSNDMNGMLAAQNSLGSGGTSYGVFNNSEDMAINLGFDGFKRGYEFYKTDWKYLNDATLRGGLNGGAVHGVMVPAGTMSIYDQVMGKNAMRPFLHVRYRASEHTSRLYQTYMTGGSSPNQTDDIDEMNVNFLTERAVCTMGANNFFIFKG